MDRRPTNSNSLTRATAQCRRMVGSLIIELVQGMGVAMGRIPQKLGQVVHVTAG